MYSMSTQQKPCVSFRYQYFECKEGTFASFSKLTCIINKPRNLISEFDAWKGQIEEEEQTAFKVYGCAKNKQEETVKYFQCNRSGVFRSRVENGKRQRHLKSGGKWSQTMLTAMHAYRSATRISFSSRIRAVQ